MDRMEVYESDGASGGLLLTWRSPVVIETLNIEKNFIDAVVGGATDEKWRLTGFYGEPKWEDKHLSWSYLRDLHSRMNIPWVVIGDFNEILYSHEKEGGARRPDRMMQEFREALVDCQLDDMGFMGDQFTSRRRRLRERLNRAVCNDGFRLLYPNATLTNAEHSKSDHRPLVLDLEGEVSMQRSHDGVKRFEARWLKENDVIQRVTEAWERTNAHASLAARTAAVHQELHAWDREVLCAPQRQLKKLKAELEQLRLGPLTDEVADRQRELLIRIEETLEKEEIYWVQRSRANWLKHGDRNTNFFNNFATARRKRNQIRKLLGEDGIWRDDVQSMGSLIADYFKDLFTSEVAIPDEEVLNKVRPRVTNYMNESLLAPYTAEEVKSALFSIGDIKAPGPDGLHAIFYKKFWPLVGDNLVKEVLDAVNTGVIPEGWNTTTIVLIPKVENAEKISHYRPISLCNVVYKVISKLLAARLKVLLPDIISETQSAFVPGRIDHLRQCNCCL